MNHLVGEAHGSSVLKTAQISAHHVQQCTMGERNFSLWRCSTNRLRENCLKGTVSNNNAKQLRDVTETDLPGTYRCKRDRHIYFVELVHTQRSIIVY